MHLMSQFKMVNIIHIPRYFNQEANEIAQRASGFKRIERKEMDQEALNFFLPSLEERGLMVEVNEIQVEGEDWRQPLIEYLSRNNSRASRALKLKSINYILYNNFLYKRRGDGLLLE